jgi:hypothetical protein
MTMKKSGLAAIFALTAASIVFGAGIVMSHYDEMERDHAVLDLVVPLRAVNYGSSHHLVGRVHMPCATWDLYDLPDHSRLRQQCEARQFPASGQWARGPVTITYR